MRAFDQTGGRSDSPWPGACRPSACGTQSTPGAVSCGAMAAALLRFPLPLSGRASERVVGRSIAASPVLAGRFLFLLLFGRSGARQAPSGRFVLRARRTPSSRGGGRRRFLRGRLLGRRRRLAPFFLQSLDVSHLNNHFEYCRDFFVITFEYSTDYSNISWKDNGRPRKLTARPSQSVSRKSIVRQLEPPARLQYTPVGELASICDPTPPTSGTLQRMSCVPLGP